MKTKTLIIGAGLSGTSLAWHLERMKNTNYTLLEAQSKAGGLCGSYKIKDFIFDYSGHLLHVSTKTGLKLVQKILGKNAALIKRKALVHLYGKEVPFPFQNNLYGLDEALVSECVKSALQAHKDKKIKDISLFKNWALALYGEAICKHFMFPYNQKLWQTDLDKLTSAWCSKFIPAATLEDIIKGAYSRRKKDFGYNSHFFYPKAGGCQTICDTLLKKVSNIKYNAPVTKINLKEKTATVKDKTISYENLVTTMPLKKLGSVIKGLPADIKKDFAALKHNSVYVLNLGVSGKTKEGHWYYFAQDKYPFYRVGVQSAFAADLAPKGASSFYVEFATPENKKPDFKKLEQETLPALRELGFIQQDAEILVQNWVEIPVAYPIYDTKYALAQKNILDYLRKQNIYLLGRYGAWEYSFMEKSLLDSADLALKLTKL